MLHKPASRKRIFHDKSIDEYSSRKNWVNVKLTCVGVRCIRLARCSRSGADRYFCCLNRRSSSYTYRQTTGKKNRERNVRLYYIVGFCRETSNYTLIKLKLNSNQGTRGVCVFTSRRLLCSVSWRSPTMASCATTTIAPVIQPIMEQSPSTAVVYCHSDAFELVLVCRSTDTNTTTKSKLEDGSNVSDSFLAILVCWWNLAFHLECFVNRYSQASVFFFGPTFCLYKCFFFPAGWMGRSFSEP